MASVHWAKPVTSIALPGQLPGATVCHQIDRFSIVSGEEDLFKPASSEHLTAQARAGRPLRSRYARTRSICSSACLVAMAWVRLKIPFERVWLAAAAMVIKTTEMAPMAIRSSIKDWPERFLVNIFKGRSDRYRKCRFRRRYNRLKCIGKKCYRQSRNPGFGESRRNGKRTSRESSKFRCRSRKRRRSRSN